MRLYCYCFMLIDLERGLMKKISIGNQYFASIREKGCFYVDKTDFIREWWETDDIVTLLTRPRRFGKTLNMDMLNCFFSNQFAGRADLFEGLSIWKEEKYWELQGTYPVISLSFANIKETTYEAMLYRFCRIVEDLYIDYNFLLKSPIFENREKEYMESIREDMPSQKAADSIHQLTKFLSRYYGKKVIILLDEYDTPMQEAYAYGYWDEMSAFIRNLFNATFKTNPYLERGIMTGITRVSKESIFSDLNNLKVVTTTSERYETCFGFTEDEVFQALDEFDLSDQKETVKEWYDGFTFGRKSDIYNPWSITNFLDSKKIGLYWANTSSNGLIGALIRQGSVNVKKIMEDFLTGGTLITQIDEQIVFNQLDSDEGAIWSLMVASGYLKVLWADFLPDGNFSYELGVTNREALFVFRQMVRRWFSSPAAHYNDFIKAMLSGDLDAMNEYMNQVAIQTFSSFDPAKSASKKDEPERFYHGFVLGLLVDLSDRYSVVPNRESGFGRYDVMIKPKDKMGEAIILEFKVHKPKREATLEDTVKKALEQIRDKRYDEELIAEGYALDRIRHYGFAFNGKSVLIGTGQG